MVKTLHIANTNTTLLYYKDRLLKWDSLQKVWSIFVFRARHWYRLLSPSLSLTLFCSFSHYKSPTSSWIHCFAAEQ